MSEIDHYDSDNVEPAIKINYISIEKIKQASLRGLKDPITVLKFIETYKNDYLYDYSLDHIISVLTDRFNESFIAKLTNNQLNHSEYNLAMNVFPVIFSKKMLSRINQQNITKLSKSLPHLNKNITYNLLFVDLLLKNLPTTQNINLVPFIDMLKRYQQ